MVSHDFVYFIIQFMNKEYSMNFISCLIPLRKRGDGLVLPITLGKFSPFESLWTIPNALSAIHSALLQHDKNLHLDFSKGENDSHKPRKQVIQTQDIESDEYENPTFLPLTMGNLIGCTFLITPTKDRQHFHACIIWESVHINTIEGICCQYYC